MGARAFRRPGREDRAAALHPPGRTARAPGAPRPNGRGQAMTGSITRVDPALIRGNRQQLAGYRASHFEWRAAEGVATLTLNRPERKNPLTFDSYAEMRDLFGRLKYADDVHAVVLVGAGDNFCSGGDVHEIIGPLVRLKAPELLMFTRMTGDLVKAM